MEEMEEPHVF